jgi:hypothetical protein
MLRVVADDDASAELTFDLDAIICSETASGVACGCRC